MTNLLKLDIIILLFVLLFMMIQIETQIHYLLNSRRVKAVNIPISLGIEPVNELSSVEFQLCTVVQEMMRKECIYKICH